VTQGKTSFSFGFSLTPGGQAADNPWKASPPPRIKLETEEFLLTLAGDWVQHGGEEPHQFRFSSERLGATAIVSFERGRLSRDRLLEGAKVLSSARIHAEVDSDPAMELGDNWVQLREEEGDVFGHVAYACYNQTSIRRFMGWVTEAKFLSFWVCTEGRDNEHSKRVFDEVFAGLRFYVP
jgi:hypothetical protein